MKIATGLPNAVPDTSGRRLVEWARRAEAAGFSSLGTIGRIVFDCHEELVALAAAAGATERIRLATTVLIGPARDPVLLAKQAATLDAVSEGRFTLGLGVGWRADDFEATGRPFHQRGETLDVQVETLRAVWRGDRVAGSGPVGPRPATPGGPELLLGGTAPAALRRAGRLADAFLAVPAPADAVRQQVETVAAAARDAGREPPRVAGAAYFALGDAARRGREAMAAYYAAGGEDFVRTMVGSLLTTPDAVREVRRAYEALGLDEVFFWPASDDPDQVDRLREALDD